MRSEIFEAAVVHQKLQAIFSDCDCNVKLTDLEEENVEPVEGVGRNSMAVMDDILSFCKEEQNKMKIKSKIALSDAQTAKYLEYLVCKKLLSENMDHYVITQKGQNLLKLFVKLHNFFGVNHS